MGCEMKIASFLFFGELEDLIRAPRTGGAIKCRFRGRQSVKHLIEALHVPHTEVGEIRVNGVTVVFSYLVKDGDRVMVFPATSAEGETTPRFVADNHLGKLATYLRILGFDTWYRNDYQDKELAEVACQEGRILLTRDRGLLMRRVVKSGYCVRSREPRQQLGEVLRRYDLFDNIQPFRRCLRCNSPLIPVSKKDVIHRLQPLTRRYYHEFRLCPECDQVYWKGSHYEHMEAFLAEITHKRGNTL